MSSEIELRKVVEESVEDALIAIGLMENRRMAAMSASMVSDLPEMKHLRLRYGTKAWCTIVFVDLRNSTNRAEQLGPEDTYVTMHALLPAMTHLVAEAGGYMVGYRGDGLFACFGIDESGRNPEQLDRGNIAANTCQCGQAMIEGVGYVVNPCLESHHVESDLHIGVGVAAGEVIFTRIGLDRAFEVTAYGSAVNKAAKLADASRDYVHCTACVEDLFPSAPGGQVKMQQASTDDFKIVFPSRVLVPPRDSIVEGLR